MTTSQPLRLATDEAKVWQMLTAYLLTFHELPPLARTVTLCDLDAGTIQECVRNLHLQGHIRRDAAGYLTIWSRRLPADYEVDDGPAY